jgi:hypothetical protein
MEQNIDEVKFIALHLELAGAGKNLARRVCRGAAS